MVVTSKMKLKQETLREIAPYSADVLDPFVLKQNLSIVDKVKVAVMTVTLLPVKLLLMLFFLVATWCFTVVTLTGLPETVKRNEKPLSGWRRKYTKPFAVFLCRLAFISFGFNWISLKGKRASVKEAPILLLVPHTSFLDTVPLSVLGCPSILVKEGTKQAPIFSTLIKYMQPLYVKRDSLDSRQQTIDEIKRRCESGDDWDQIVICPEGTCGNGQAFLDFKLGAFYPGVPVQPVFFRYPNKLDTITWTWDGPGAFRQVWLTLCQAHIFCELEFLPVYKPSQAEKDSPHLFAKNVRKMISKLTGTPISYFSLEDVKYLQLATKKELPRTVGVTSLIRLRRKLGYEVMDVNDEIRNLLNKPLPKETLCNLSDFARYLGSPISEAIKSFFNLVDQDHNGKIDVRTYSAGLWLLNSKIPENDRLESAFKVFNSDGMVTSSQFSAVVFLWRGIPKRVSDDIFDALKLESSEKEVAFRKLKSFLVNNPPYQDCVPHELSGPKQLVYSSNGVMEKHGKGKLS